MKNIKSFLNDFAGYMKNDGFFKDIKIISAYPLCKKPVKLLHPVVAVGFSNVKVSPHQIGSNAKAGEVSLFADIYVPSNMKTDCICDIFCRICASAGQMNISSVSCGKTEYDKTAEAYVTKTVVTFNDEISFGGENGE